MKPAIPHIGFGTWVFGGRHWNGQDEKQSISTLHAAIDQGITHVDTAQGYGSGSVETLIGNELSGRENYNDLFLATKTFTKTPEKLEQLIDVSRQRLKRDCIDLYYLHWPRRGLDLRPLLEILENARSRGHIRHIGVSNFSIDDLRSVQEVATIDVHQIGWNLIWRKDETELIPYCRDQGIKIVAYSALAHGILTGKFDAFPAFTGDDFRRDTVPFRTDVWPWVHQFVNYATVACQNAEIPLSKAATAWLTERTDAILFGARTPQQLSEIMPIQEVPSSLLRKLTKLSDKLQGSIPDAPNVFDYRP